MGTFTTVKQAKTGIHLYAKEFSMVINQLENFPPSKHTKVYARCMRTVGVRLETKNTQTPCLYWLYTCTPETVHLPKRTVMCKPDMVYISDRAHGLHLFQGCSMPALSGRDRICAKIPSSEQVKTIVQLPCLFIPKREA